MDSLRNFVRETMMHIAHFLDLVTKGKLKPAHVTTLSLLGHIPVAWALVASQPVLAAVLLAVFSLLDALDGALARAQGIASKSGMYFDAVSDRLKEIIVYSALAVFIFNTVDPNLVWQVVALCGSSLLVSYVKAKGEMAVANNKSDVQKLNRTFGGGLASYEFRVVALVVGLLFGIIEYILPIMLALTLLTAALRFLSVSRVLHTLDVKTVVKKQKQKS